MLEIGDSVSEKALDAVEENQFVNEACLLVYTSGTQCRGQNDSIGAMCNLLVIGTTGPPKAAMLCHDNITYGATISKVAYCWEQGR